ncbi:response regulator transcription factor [Sediminibacterium ginsengisoli]|uniref:DNA-binding response regulator, NarL/FixJ family, contains REC and HTH domains n=1 Tax=Sediminibacterium ginsengisoli TaxID=413434 RepID=A0A1T4R384_9BACT|nr:response regulator transcription factor [Sediminibacterium ginsengisoli]SKA10429.1 DNA-binding response regulator, NarL/FixJ family, contains REC and HTH domains [Sediminibacterium ginsengisoli]
MKQQKIKVALVDDHTLFRSGIANLLLEFDDIEIGFEAPNGKELQKKMPQHADTDVVLMDINMPGMDGYTATRWMRVNYPHIPVLALSMFDEETAIINMLKAGAGGYVLKESNSTDLHRAISEIFSKGYYINDLVSGNLVRSLQHEGSADPGPKLTDKEKQFVTLCASELSYKEIAHVMGISVRTTEHYRDLLCEKLHVKTRIGIILACLKNGVLSLQDPEKL